MPTLVDAFLIPFFSDWPVLKFESGFDLWRSVHALVLGFPLLVVVGPVFTIMSPRQVALTYWAHRRKESWILEGYFGLEWCKKLNGVHCLWGRLH